MGCFYLSSVHLAVDFAVLHAVLRALSASAESVDFPTVFDHSVFRSFHTRAILFSSISLYLFLVPEIYISVSLSAIVSVDPFAERFGIVSLTPVPVSTPSLISAVTSIHAGCTPC